MSQGEIAIKVDNVSKSFKLPHEKQNSIKGLFVNIFRGKRTYEHQQVLKDISFEIKKGEFFGIVGRNGSGKSTLLKLLAGIYLPDKGYVQTNGTLTPFIELGVGFNPELTGRENVFLNGALLGFDRKEMMAMYEEIVEFAELEKFMDQKLKNYSSGMQVRLAFSIAIRARSEILLLDEVLAVGDEAFQKKCFSYFEQLKEDKRTVILVTHDMSSVQQYCNRAMLVHDGDIKFIGNPRLAAMAYKRLNFPDMAAQELSGLNSHKKDKSKTAKAKKIQLTRIEAVNQQGHKDAFISSGDPFRIRFLYNANENLDNVVFGVAIKSSSGESIYGPNTKESRLSVNIKKGKGSFELFVKNNVFAPGSYTVDAGVFSYDTTACYDYVSLKDGITFVGLERHGYAYVEPQWTIR